MGAHMGWKAFPLTQRVPHLEEILDNSYLLPLTPTAYPQTAGIEEVDFWEGARWISQFESM